MTTQSTYPNLCTAGLTTLSPFAIVTTGPTAAAVSVSGHVRTNNGRGLRNAIVTMTDSHGVARMAVTGAYGTYRFDNVESGQTYLIAVRSKRFSFARQVVSVNDVLTDVDFVAQ
jgi:hypothetical protein